MSIYPFRLHSLPPRGKVLWLRPEGTAGKGLTFWIMMVKGPSIWKPRAKYMTLHQPSTSARDMGTTSPLVLVSRIAMVTSTREA